MNCFLSQHMNGTNIYDYIINIKYCISTSGTEFSESTVV